MRPTDILSGEHRVIEQVLDCLAALSEQAAQSAALDTARAAQVLEVLRTFADRCHHGKEEDLLFKRMGERGMPTHVGPIGVMLSDHEAGREYIARMGLACESANAADFSKAGLSYVELMRDHIAKEDGVLFPMAESMLDEAGRAELVEAFRNFEHEDLGAGTHERMLAIADELADHYGVALAASRSASGTAGCCSHH